MTAEKSKGRGGKRAGAGRKPKPRAPVVEASLLPMAATVADDEPASKKARRHTAKMIEVLDTIAREGSSEQARVAAAKALLERGWGPPNAGGEGDDGQDKPGMAAKQEDGWNSLLN